MNLITLPPVASLSVVFAVKGQWRVKPHVLFTDRDGECYLASDLDGRRLRPVSLRDSVRWFAWAATFAETSGVPNQTAFLHWMNYVAARVVEQ